VVIVRAILVLLLLLWPSIAHAEKRIALVIGNGAYTKVPSLDNPKNDAAAMEEMFKAAGFDTVVRANDLGVTAMRRALRDFSDTAHDADIAIVFYAGHGIEVSGTNYMIPIDAVLEQDIDAPDEAVPLDRVTEILEPAKRLRLVILDACRDNPFVRSMRRTLATRTVRSGYGEIDERSLPPNTLVAYAQRAGATAVDGEGANSPYTAALLKHLPMPGLDIELALRRVRDDVLKATRNKQEPFKYGSLGGAEIPLVPGKGLEPAAAAPPTPAVNYDKEMENIFWDAVKDSKSKDLLQTYLDRYPSGNFAGLAKVLTDKLEKEPPTADAAADKAAEQAKLARALQAELKRVGCDPGNVDGVWGDKAKDALAEFTRVAKVTLPSDEPSPEVLQIVLRQKGRICFGGQTGFDGRWRHVWRAISNHCGGLQSNTTYLTINNGKVLGERIVSGHIRPDGVIFYTRRALINLKAIGHFSGKLIGNEGSTTERNGKCVGRVTLTRVSG
jgi:Caspase domain